MRNLYHYSSYKAFLLDLSEAKDLSFVRLAEGANVQKQYMSAVLRKDAHLSEDQAFDLGCYLKFDEEELDYWLLLVRENKCARQSTRKHLKQKIDKVQSEKKQLSKNLPKTVHVIDELVERNLEQYFFDSWLQQAHLNLFLPAFQKNLPALAQKLRITLADLKSKVQSLLELNLVQKQGDKYIAKSQSFHVDKNSILAEQNHRNWRVVALNSAPSSVLQNFRYTGSIVADEKSKAALVDKLKQVLSDFHKEVASAPEEKVFQLNFDVFDL